MRNAQGKQWYHYANCNGLDLNLFYDQYESDSVLAGNIDEICLTCPVRPLCLKQGLENKEYGLWGGFYLSNGKIDQEANSHKSDEWWDNLV